MLKHHFDSPQFFSNLFLYHWKLCSIVLKELDREKEMESNQKDFQV